MSTTKSFSFGLWTITETKSHILESEGEKRREFEENLELPHLPEMLFADNSLEFVHKNGFGIKFCALDALKGVDAHRDLIKVAYADEWKESRTSQEGVDNVVQPHDWTYTTDYKGSLISGELESIKVIPTKERINLEKLKIREKILFYSDILLFEDELGDNGEAKLGVKVRVMPSGFFILSRFYMRVDDVIVRRTNINNNAYDHDFIETLPVLLKDDSTKRFLLGDPDFHHYLIANPSILAELWLEEESREILRNFDDIRCFIDHNHEFMEHLELLQLKKNIPCHDLFIRTLLNPKLLKLIERNEDLQQACIDDVSLQIFISTKKDIRDKLEKNPSYISTLLKQPEVIDNLINLPETQRRLETIRSKEMTPHLTLPVLKYNSTEMELFENETKRAVYTLNKNVNSYKSKMRETIEFENFNGDYERRDFHDILNTFPEINNLNKIDAETKRISFERINDKLMKFNASSNNSEFKSNFLDGDEDPQGICRAIGRAKSSSVGNVHHLNDGDEVSGSDGSQGVYPVNNEQFSDLQRQLSTVEKDRDEAVAQLRVVAIEYEKQKEKASKLTTMLHEKNLELKEGVLTLIENGQIDTTQSIVEAEIRIRALEIEIENHKQDADAKKVALQTVVKENTELMRKLKEFTRELIVEKSIVSQITASRVDLEATVHRLTTERDNFKAELLKIDELRSKVELEAKEELSKIENDMRKIKTEYDQAIAIMKDDNHMLMTEVACAKALSEARTGEMDQTKNLLAVANLEIEDLNRKLEVITEENLSSRTEIDRVMQEYDKIIRENCATKELIEKTRQDKEKLLSDKYSLERDVERLSDELDGIKEDLIESGRRMGDARHQAMESEKLYQNSHDMTLSLQADLRHAQSQLQAAEDEKKCLGQRLQKFAEQNKLLSKNMNNLKQQMSAGAEILKEERRISSERKSELKFLNDAQEKLKSELELLQTAFDKEQNLHMSLREQYILEEQQQSKLNERIKSYEMEVNTLEQKLREERSQFEQTRYEKEKVIEETKVLYDRIENFERLLSIEQTKYKQVVEKMRQDFVTDLDFAKREKGNMNEMVSKFREEINDLKEQIRTKDLQIRSCYQSIGQMDSEARGRKELECQLFQAETELKEAQGIVETIHSELILEREKQSHLSQQNDKLLTNINQLKEGLKLVKEEYTKEVFRLSHELQQISLSSEEEIRSLRDSLNKSNADLLATEASLLALQEVRENLHSSNKNFEKTIDALKRRLHQEMTAKRLVEQQLDVLRKQHEYLTKNTDHPEDYNSQDLVINYNKLQIELQAEKDEVLLLRKQLQATQASSYTQEAHMQTLELQLAESQSQVSSLKRKFELQIMPNESKTKLDKDLRNQLALYEKERMLFFQNAQKLSQDLELAREQSNNKTRDIIKLEEQIGVLKQTISEMQHDIKITEDVCKTEGDKMDRLERRNHELESQNIKLKAQISNRKDNLH
ncbi:DgyrCDS1385 [Dimorphilus gyrociliatus]|uniref:TIP41-like protein n=1 Tax=Dimorphilus gyrociliatus TaxID=2664684 RepID=A0A7I8V739_9ANNE|nr:DgyrCDS1385 [Dimorphilus gyrociliatus]